MIKIVVNYNDYLWGDSTLEKIEIEMEYSNIIFTIFNDMAQKIFILIVLTVWVCLNLLVGMKI